MRILAGTRKGHKLRSPKAGRIRPTTARVRSSLFETLKQQVVASRFLDLCAGTGAVGIEALSRGAKEAVFVELHRSSVHMLRSNLLNAGCEARAAVLGADVLRALTRLARQKRAFDILFADPPYDGGLGQDVLCHLGEQSGLIAGGGLVIMQHFHKDDMPERAGVLVAERRRVIGDSALTYYRSDSGG